LDLNSYLFTYREAADLSRDDLAFRRNNPNIGVPFTALGFGRNVAPAGPGELVLTVARPSNMKTGTLCIIADAREHELAALGEDRHILIVTAETTIEKLMHNFIAAATGVNKTELAWGQLEDQQWKDVDRYTLVEVARNIWLYGNSSRMAAKRYLPPAEMKPQTIANAIDAVANWHKGRLNVIDMVAVDYFQMLEPNHYDQEARVRYENVMRDLKRIALMLPGPLFVACQAKQDVDKRDDPLPQQGDIEQTNEAHKAADIIISQIVPSIYPAKLKKSDVYHDITLQEAYYSQLLLYSLVKHKSSAFPQDHWVFVDRGLNRIIDPTPFMVQDLNNL
jgi:replicative DNA helicase